MNKKKKTCKHEWRYLALRDGLNRIFYSFYCIYCLKTTKSISEAVIIK